jgi:hypothetical protein
MDVCFEGAIAREKETGRSLAVLWPQKYVYGHSIKPIALEISNADVSRCRADGFDLNPHQRGIFWKSC